MLIKSADANDIPGIIYCQYWPQSRRLKIRAKVITPIPKEAYLHPLKDVYVQYVNNTANSFRDIVRKMNLSSAIKSIMATKSNVKK